MKIRKQTLGEYLRDPDSMLETRDIWHDGMAAVSWFSGTHVANWVGIPERDVPKRMAQSLRLEWVLDRAVKRLQETFWFGFLEDMDTSLTLLGERFNMHVPQHMSRANAGHHHPKATAEEKEMLRRLMPLDLWFHDYAKKLYQRRLQGDYSPLPYTIPSEKELLRGSCVSSRKIIRCFEDRAKGSQGYVHHRSEFPENSPQWNDEVDEMGHFMDPNF